MSVHIDRATKSGHIFSHPKVILFTESWFQWLEHMHMFDIYDNGPYDDDRLCEVYKEQEVWYARYYGHRKNYTSHIGSSHAFTYDALWSALQYIWNTAVKEEGSLRRQ